MTPGDDVVDLVVGESEYSVTVAAGTLATGTLTMLQVMSSSAPLTGATSVSVQTTTNYAEAARTLTSILVVAMTP